MRILVLVSLLLFVPSAHAQSCYAQPVQLQTNYCGAQTMAVQTYAVPVAAVQYQSVAVAAPVAYARVAVAAPVYQSVAVRSYGVGAVGAVVGRGVSISAVDRRGTTVTAVGNTNARIERGLLGRIRGARVDSNRGLLGRINPFQ